LNNAREIRLWKYFDAISEYIKTGRENIFNSDLSQHLSKISESRKKFQNKNYPKFVAFIEGLLDRDNSKKIDKDFGDIPIDKYPLNIPF
jgi:hypothetical protein